MAIQAGSHLGLYEIQAAIGAGGLGEIYRARERGLERTVAIKVLQQTSHPMVSFIHIADKNYEASIRKNGIRAPKRSAGHRGVYAIPVLPNFTTTHQWARELKRLGARTLVCVQFRIPNDEPVIVGKYNGEKRELTAAEAAAAFLEHTDPMGLEAIIPRRISAKEISRTYLAPQLSGWRYYPEAKGRKPFCNCKFCNKGEIRAQRLIREYD